MRIAFFFLVFLTTVAGYAQDSTYARKIINTLTAPNFHGRGYVEAGQKKAADFLAAELEKIGVEPLRKNFLQEFPLDVNTFPGAMALAINGKALKPGEDFVVNPSSGGAAGEFGVVHIAFDKFKDEPYLINLVKEGGLKNKIVVLNHAERAGGDTLRAVQSFAGYMAQVCPVLIVTDTKFTWSVGREQLPYPLLEVKREAAQLNDKNTIKLAIESKFLENYKAHNVLGCIPGKVDKKKFIVFTAHYDHLGRMGTDTYFPGANDNASGTSMVLNLAKHYVANPHDYSIVVLFFGAEEAGILGSHYFTEHPKLKLANIQFLVNMDIMGTGDEGITVVNGSLHREQFDKMVAINEDKGYLAQVKIRGKAMNSDHYWFTEKGVPAFFIYTMGGIKAYHDVYDRPETLPLTEYEDVFRLLTDFADSFTN